MTETSRHLLDDCVHVKNIWNLFNSLVNQIGNRQECVNNYEDVFQACELLAIDIVKIKINKHLFRLKGH
jgi:hypothetical protein